jgi:soluble P-type ATPase
VVLAVGGVARAVCGLKDRPRPEARAVVAYLRGALGLQVWMLTGDSAATAARVAAAVGMDPRCVLAGELPGGKAGHVARMEAAGHRCAMVGDGINDAPALKTASLGVAIGAGAQIAVAAADVVLLNSHLADVVTALALARATLRRIYLNFLWALGYNALAIPLAAGVLYASTQMSIAPEAAGAAMALSSVSVVVSSLCLKRFRKPTVPTFSDSGPHPPPPPPQLQPAVGLAVRTPLPGDNFCACDPCNCAGAPCAEEGTSGCAVAALAAAAPQLRAWAAGAFAQRADARPAVSIVDLSDMSPACNCTRSNCLSNTLVTPHGARFAALKRLQQRCALRAGEKPVSGASGKEALDSDDEHQTLLALADSTGGTDGEWEDAAVGAGKE